MIVNICGVPYKVIECVDEFDADTHFGMIDYKKCVIKINKNMDYGQKKDSLCHEMVHGMLFHMGFEESQNEHLVQALGNAISQGFDVRDYDISEETDDTAECKN